MMEKHTTIDENNKASHSISIIRSLLKDDSFKNEHRTASKFFTRKLKLDFVTVILLILQKSIKPLQLVLNEFFKKLDKGVLVTKSAFTQARRHLKATAFITLNQKAVLAVLYGDDNYEKAWGFRLLAIDGSKIHLPNTPEIRQEFGTLKFEKTVGKNKKITGEHGYALASVIYDPLNKVVIDACLAPAKAYEVDLALQQLKHTQANDLILFDRNYPSYVFLASLAKLNRQFVGRCSKGSFKAAQEMFKQNITDSSLATLKAEGAVKKKCKALGLPEKITVRFVRVLLSTGEIEVLVTSLLDEQKYPAPLFKELYHLRWGIEGFLGVLKERLKVDNFTGKTVISIKQDFYATVFLTGLESILTQNAETQLFDKYRQNKHRQTVNNMVSFNAIKNFLVELFFHCSPLDELMETLNSWFIKDPTYVKREREVLRKKNSSTVSLNYYKRVYKPCF